MTDDAHIAFWPTSGLSYVVSTSTFTVQNPGTGGWTLTAGDKFIWDANAGTPPGGFSAWTPYYAVNVSGSQFQMSPTPGGSPQAMSGSDGTTSPLFVASAPSSTLAIDTPSSATSQISSIMGALSLAQAVGATVDSALVSDLQARITAASISYTTSPKYKFSTSY